MDQSSEGAATPHRGQDLLESIEETMKGSLLAAVIEETPSQGAMGALKRDLRIRAALTGRVLPGPRCAGLAARREELRTTKPHRLVLRNKGVLVKGTHCICAHGAVGLVFVLSTEIIQMSTSRQNGTQHK